MKNHNSDSNAKNARLIKITVIAISICAAIASAAGHFAGNKSAVQEEADVSINETTTIKNAQPDEDNTAQPDSESLNENTCDGDVDDEWTEMEYPGLASAKIEFKGRTLEILSKYSEHSAGFEASGETLGAGELASAFTEHLKYEISIFNTSDKEQKVDDCVICGIASHYPDAVELSVNGIGAGSTRADVEKTFSGLEITFDKKGVVELSDGYFHVNIYFMDDDDIVDNISVNDFSVWYY